MARTIIKTDDNNIETKTARTKIKVKNKNTIVWASLIPGVLHLGYRKLHADKPGVWIVRRRMKEVPGQESPYVKKTLKGHADDGKNQADGVHYLSYNQAAEAARGAFSEETERKNKPVTVAEAVEDYLQFLEKHKKTGADARIRANAQILPELGKLRVDELTTDRLKRWRNAMAEAPPRLRTAKGKKQQFRSVPTTPEERRKRYATANRTVTVLKAALTQAFNEGRVNEDREWRRLKPFPKVEAPREDHLSVAEVVKLIAAADEPSGFRNMVRAAVYTGCRYGELCRLKVKDFGGDVLHIRESKSGKPRNVILIDEGQAFFREMAKGKKPDDILLPRADGSAWKKSHQSRLMNAATEKAGVTLTYHGLRHTWASLAVMNGMSLLMVADALGHKDTRMVERVYGHLTPEYRRAMYEQFSPRFDGGNVVSLDEAREKASK